MHEKSAKQINAILFSNDTVRCRINNFSTYVKTELITRLKCYDFSLQMDKSIDVSGLDVLLVFVRYKYQTSIEEDLLLCQSLPTNASGCKKFNMLNNFFEKEGLAWIFLLTFVQMELWSGKLLA